MQELGGLLNKFGNAFQNHLASEFSNYTEILLPSFSSHFPPTIQQRMSDWKSEMKALLWIKTKINFHFSFLAKSCGWRDKQMLQDLEAVIRGGSVVGSRHQGKKEGEEGVGFLRLPRALCAQRGIWGNSQSEGPRELDLPFSC